MTQLQESQDTSENLFDYLGDFIKGKGRWHNSNYLSSSSRDAEIHINTSIDRKIMMNCSIFVVNCLNVVWRYNDFFDVP